MPRSVALDGDVSFETSTATHPSDTQGTGRWQLDNSDVTRGENIVVHSKYVQLRATATWSYVDGSTPSGPLPTINDSATLTPTPSTLMDDDRYVLVDGDQASGTVDPRNRIVVSVQQSWLSTN